ncbi:MAG TPA: universal stress protein [Terriglobales bacterium]|nr:universal stress protein [Terriglobales bacterium]
MSTAAQLEARTYFKNILVATDFSEVSRIALQFAAGLAEEHQGRLLIAHMLPPLAREPIPLEMPASLETERSQARRQMEALAGEEFLSHVRHEERIERGDSWLVLLDLIEEQGIDLLVLGTHARTGLKKLVLGSVTEQLFRLAPCPVMTVSPHVAFKARDGGSVQEVLFATDFGRASRNALPYAIALANEKRARLCLLHVITPLPPLSMGPSWYPGTEGPARQEEEVLEAEKRLRELVPAKTSFVNEPEFVVELAQMPEAILKTAFDRNADLIVMGVKAVSPGQARAAAHVPWPTAHEVVCHAECPVITVRG